MLNRKKRVIMSENNNMVVNRILPVVALRGMTILPGAVIHFDLNRQKSISAVEKAMMSGGWIFLVTQKDTEEKNPSYEQLYHIGTMAIIKQITKLPNRVIRVLVEGVCRGEFLAVDNEKTDFIEAQVREISKEEEWDILPQAEAGARCEAMLRQLKEYFGAYATYYPKMGQTATKRYADVQDLSSLMDQIAMNMPLDYPIKQKMLEAVLLTERYDIICEILINEIEVAKVKTELAQKIKSKVDKNQKEYLLREQLHYIKEELGEGGSLSDAEQFLKAVEELPAKEEVKEKIKKEIFRFQKLSPNSSESSVERAYIETLLELPWDRVSEDNESVSRAEEILDREHYGLEKVKERILEFLAVRCLTKKGDSPILCLVGPPGTGKTSIARSVAKALDKQYIRICLGGVRDEAEIRGHRKTYVGAMPGRLVAGLRQAGVKNPLMLLDEIDKVSNDYKGDTFSALLEVLDSEQNVRFRDHYVEIPIDLSEVLFIATANTTQTIPRPLLDRMEIIEINSYTENEKFHIAKEHLLGKQLAKNGLNKSMLSIRDSAIKSIITYYTKEAGVRNLERKLGDICRKAAREILKAREAGEEFQRISVTASNLEEYLGKKKYSLDKANKKPEIGIVRGLAWTSVGGDTLQIEVNRMPGKGEIELTGQMGDVMKESAMIAMSYVRSVGEEYGIKPEVFKEYDFHIHIPEGAVPKDGPSAGITMATALFSAVTGRLVRSDIAMTGEVTLRGRALPIGGLKEKILAAKMAGIGEVLVPTENRKDIAEISEEIKEGLVITYVKDMRDVLSHALIGK